MNPKKIFLILAGVSGILAVLIFSSVLFVQTHTFQRLVLKQINQGIPGQLSWEDLSVSVFSGSIRIKEITLKGTDDVMIIQIPELSVSLSWRNLVSGEIHFPSIRIDSPVLNLELLQQGALNLLSAVVPPSQAPAQKPDQPFALPLNIRADKIAFNNATIDFKIDDQEFNASVSGFDLLITDLDLLNQSARIISNIRQGVIHHKDVSVVISPFSAQADVLKEQVSHILVQTGLNGLDIDLRGKVEALLSDPVLDLSMNTRVDFEPLKKIMPAMDFPTGTAEVALSAKGPPGNPDVTLAVTYGPGTFQDQPVTAVRLKSILKDRVLTLLPSSLESGFGNLFLDGVVNFKAAFPDGFLDEKQDLDQVLFQFNTRQDGTELSSVVGNDLKGRLSSIVTLNGKGLVPEKMKAEISADIQAQQFAYQSLPPAAPLDIRVKVMAGLEGDHAKIHSLGISSEGMDLTGEGHLDMPGFDIAAMAVSGQLRLDARNLTWLEHLTRIRSHGQVMMTADLNGSVFSPEILLAATAEEFKMDQFYPGHLELNARLDKTGRVHVDRIMADRQGALADAHGWMDLFDRGFSLKPLTPMDLSLSFDKLGIKTFLPDQDLDGVFSGTIDVTGTPASPSARATVQGKGIRVQTIRIGDADAQMAFSNGVLNINNTMIRNQNSRVDINGRVMVLNPDTKKMTTRPDMDLTLAAASIFLEDFFPDMKGKVSLNGRIKGTVEQLAGNLTLTGNHIDIHGQALEKITAVTTIRDKAIEINEMEILVSPDSRINAKGRVLLPEKTMDIRMTAQAFDLTRIHAVQQKVLQSGKLSLDVTASGKIDNPSLAGNVHVRQIRIFQEKSDPIDLVLELENKLLHVTGKMGPTIDGNYHLDTGEFSAALSMDALALGPYFKLAGQPDMAGNVTAVIRAQGHADQPAGIQASADISSLDLSWENQPILKIGQTTASFAKGGLTLPGTRIDFVKSGSLTITGQGSFDNGLDFDANGSFPLEIIPSLVKEIETATGTIHVAASLKGNIKDPLVRADLTFDDLGLTLNDLEQEFKHVAGHIRVTPQKIEILRFTGQLDQGRFDLGGSVGLAGGTFQDMNLKLAVQQLTLAFPDLMELTLNSHLTLSGNREKSDLTGEIVLLEGRYYRDVKLDLIAAATQRTRKIDPLKPKTKNPFLESIALNVHVSRRDPLLVENNLAYLLVSPDLTIRGTAHRPLLSGRATVNSGTISFQKSEFEVKKGIIDFINPYQIEPTIEIEGEMNIRTWTITLTVSGTPDNLDLKFSSDPSESQADIISLIAFGKTSREMGQAQGSGQVASGQIVSGLLGDALKKDLKAATGMDQLDIGMESSGSSGSQGVRVTMGKELSRQMGVTYGVSTRDGETVQRVTTYYKILENLLMSGFQDSGGKFGGELKYRLEFR